VRFGRPGRRPGDHEEVRRPKFLWWPLTFDGETRWLESAEIVYRYHRSMDGDFWEPVRFDNL
jgi:hypothetical protein